MRLLRHSTIAPENDWAIEHRQRYFGASTQAPSFNTSGAALIA